MTKERINLVGSVCSIIALPLAVIGLVAVTVLDASDYAFYTFLVVMAVAVVVLAWAIITSGLASWLWVSKDSVSEKTASFLKWIDRKWYSWFYCFPLLHKAVQRSKDIARKETKREVFTRIVMMLSDAEDQRYGSYVAVEGDVEAEKIEKEIETVAIGRIEALKDIKSYLYPNIFPSEEWDNRGKNTTSPGTVMVRGRPEIYWELHDNDNHIPKRWIYIERLEEKWGRKHRYYFRPDLKRDAGTL